MTLRRLYAAAASLNLIAALAWVAASRPVLAMLFALASGLFVVARLSVRDDD